VFVSSSAVGFYGVSDSATFDEDSPSGHDFLSQVCQRWEAEANKAETRVVVIRTGIVMATEGGALAKMLPMFEMFLGAPTPCATPGSTQMYHFNTLSLLCMLS
jgi:uncharacterized protein